MVSGTEEAPEQSSSATTAGTIQLQQAWRWEAVADSLCPICLGNVDNAAYIDACCHRFCFGCIQQWAATRAVCPLCQQPFDHILHMVRADDDYQEYVIGSSAHRQRSAARERVRSRSLQRHYHLRQGPTNTGPATGRRGPAGRDQAAQGDAALGPSNASAQQATGERPAMPPVLRIGMVVVLLPLRIKLSERRLQ